MCFLSLSSAEDVIDLNGNNYDELPPSASDVGVEYDSVLRYQFLVSEWVYVSVRIKDFSNVTIDYDNDSVELQEIKDNQIWDVYRDTSESVLNTLSEDEFRLKTMSPWGTFFSGNITEEGFEKLLNDTRVSKIYAKKKFTSYLSSSNPALFVFIILILLLIVLITSIYKIIKRRVGKHEKS